MRRIWRTLAIGLTVVSLAAGCQALTGKTAGETIDDATLTATVKSKLVADKATNVLRIDVDTNRGTVYLNGIVETADQRARAEEIARRVDGVKGVVNNLQTRR